MENRKKILVAPLNWGLGYAMRCIPVIEALENHGYEPVLASDGDALALLKKEFPLLQAMELPAYQIEYAKNGAFLKLRQLIQMPGMFKAVLRENKMVTSIIAQHHINGVISDNRLGAFSATVPSVFITHQLTTYTGTTTPITNKIHRLFLKKYRECWVPDSKTSPNFSGKLGHTEAPGLNLKYIGPVSRLHKKTACKKYDLMVLLTGPGTQRDLLEQLLCKELFNYRGDVLFVRGIMDAEQKIEQAGNTTYYNFMDSAEMEMAFNESDIIITRPGYTTIMDLAKLGRRAFFIPEPGVYEEMYLAKKLKRAGLAPFSFQENFKLADLEKAPLYKGLKDLSSNARWKDLFCLFEGK